LLATLALGSVCVAGGACDEEVVVKTSTLGAHLELAAGEVLLVEDGSEQRLLSHTPLPVGAKLKTGAGARALVRLSDGTRLFLREGTTVGLDEGIALEQGQVWLEAPPLERGQEATIHNLGATTLSLSDGGASLTRGEGEATIYVAEGLAVVTSPGGRSEVNAGEQATIAGEAAPSIEPVKFWEDWTGGMGDRSASAHGGGAGSGSLYAVDRDAPPGAPALPLSVQRQSVRIAVDGQLSETVVDQRFFNPSSRDVEGWYWFTVPEGAQLVSFALETDGVLIEGEVVERQQAKSTYEGVIERGRDPALLEWVDSRTARARIYPVPALGERRIVVRYQQLLTEAEGKMRYSYPLAGPVGRDAPTIEEFALEVDLRGDLSKTYEVATLSEARIDPEGRNVTMRRSGYTPRADFELELRRKPDAEADERPPLRVNEVDPGNDQARFVMVRWAPDLDLGDVEPAPGNVVVVIDTSAAGDGSEHQSKIAVAEALLRSLSEGDRFAVMSADLQARVLHPQEGLAEATPEAISTALESVAQHGTGGATDLGAIFEMALDRVHGLEQPAIVYVGDGLATSGDRGGDALSERLRRSMAGSKARLFTVGVGAEIDEAMLSQLARVGGGESLRVEVPEQAVVRALELSGALKTPTLTDLKVDLGEGLDNVFVNVSGKISRGQEMVLLARTHHELPEKVKISGRMGSEPFEREYELEEGDDIIDPIVPRLWAATFVERLLGDPRGPEAVRGKILALGLEYGLMTPHTSYLALESEMAYSQNGVQRRHRPFAGTRLIASAEGIRRAQQDSSGSEGSSAQGLILGIAAAPLGCGSESAPWTGGNDDTKMVAEMEDAVMEPVEGEPAPAARGGASAMDGPLPEAPGGDKIADGEVMEEQVSRGAVALSGLDEDDGAGGGYGKGASENTRSQEKKSGKRPKKKSPGRAGGSGDGGERESRESEVGYLDARVADDATFALANKDELAKGDMGGMGRRLGTSRDIERERRSRRNRPLVASPIARHRKLPCSDAAQRSLHHRRLLWQRRLKRQVDILGALDGYEASVGSCEVTNWKHQRVYLDLLQRRAESEQDIQVLLGHFHDEPDARSYLAKALLRRVVDPRLVAAIEGALYGGRVDWWDVDRRVALELDEATRIEIVAAALARNPGDPMGERRMIDLLARQGKIDEALARGHRLRDQGSMTPHLAQQLGEIMVEAGRDDEARRLFSEIVEFNPNSAGSRRLLGDIFLRHGWYDDAYHQYRDLHELAGDDPSSTIRLARAAAGAGRVDEGLRLLRGVSAGEGRPGVHDPRPWARLHAAVYLAEMFGGEVSEQSLERELKRLDLFESGSQWVILVWEDLDADLRLAVKRTESASERRSQDAQEREGEDIQAATLAVDAINGSATGLYAIPLAVGERPEWLVRHAGISPDREVAYRTITLRFEKDEFEVTRDEGKLARDGKSASAGEAAGGD
jgi:tetratricopeptide (TPR) repeat protein